MALLVCVGVRAGILLVRDNAFAADPDAYSAIASTIAQHGVFGLTSPEGVPRAIAFRPPLYPWLLSWVVVDGDVSRVGIGAFHVCLALVTVVCVFNLTRQLVGHVSDDAFPRVCTSRRAQWIAMAAAVLVSIDPLLLNQSSEVMTETLATAIATVIIYVWYRWYGAESDRRSTLVGFGLGVGLAVAYFCRPTFLAWAVLLCLATLLANRKRTPITKTLAIGLPVLIAVSCWTLRNQAVTGHPVWATTHGGYTLLLGNNESFYDYLEQGAFGEAWDATDFFVAYQHRFSGDPTKATFWSTDWNSETKPPAEGTGLTEYDDDRLAYRSAVATIARRPLTFAWSALVRIGRLWSPMPHQLDDRSTAAVTLVTFYYGGLWIAVLIAIYRHRRGLFGTQYAAIWLLALTLTAVHAVYWSNMRMRSPVMPAAIVIASLAVAPPRRNGPTTTAC